MNGTSSFLGVIPNSSINLLILDNKILTISSDFDMSVPDRNVSFIFSANLKFLFIRASCKVLTGISLMPCNVPVSIISSIPLTI